MLGGLLAVAAVAAVMFGFRIYGRAYRSLLAAMGIWMMNIAIPAYLLGWLGRLTDVGVGIATATVSLGMVAATVLSLRSGERRTFVSAAFGHLGGYPLRAFKETWRTSPLVFIGLIVVVGLALWTPYIAYLVPSHSWDGLWYHESIIGYAIQNQGFDWVDGPRRMQFVNGYPRMSETFNLFFALFAGRYLIDAVAPFMMIISFSAMVGLLRPLVFSNAHALGWSLGLVLMPAVVVALCSTLIDVTFLAGFLLALFFMTRPSFHRSDLVLGGLLTGMMGAMKGTGLLIAPVLMLIGVIRVVVAAKQSGARREWLLLVPMALCATLLFSPTYVRNLAVTGNPVWPLKTNVLGIELPGTAGMRMSRPGSLEELFSSPDTVYFADARKHGYGGVLPFVLPVLVIFAVASLSRRLLRRKRDPSHVTLLFATAAVVPSMLLSPGGLWWARLNLHGVVWAIMLGAWVLGRPGRRHIAEGVLGAVVVGSLLTLVWIEPTWGMPMKRWDRLTQRSMEYREHLPFWKRTMLPKKMLVRRCKEIGAGDVVAFDGAYRFPANLWNVDFSNRVVYLPRKHRRLRHLDKIGTEWVVVKKGSRLDEKLQDASDEWEALGAVDRRNRGYRRVDAD